MALAGACIAHAQRANVHFHHAGESSPGAIGSRQLLRGGPWRGYVQPVEIKAPSGALVSLAAGGRFERPQPTPRRVGMTISPVYRFRVTNIPRRPGLEVYPTLEILDRLYPPVGKAWRFPIVVELDQKELELALAGKYVTRVIYLEDPNFALPAATADQPQQWLRTRPHENPLEVADWFGRPVAILRIGSRLPMNVADPGERFLYGSPPWTKGPPQSSETVPAPRGVPLPRAASAMP